MALGSSPGAPRPQLGGGRGPRAVGLGGVGEMALAPKALP